MFLYLLIPLILAVSVVPLNSFAETGTSGIESQTKCRMGMSPVYDNTELVYFCASNSPEYGSFTLDNSKTECREGLVLVYHNAKRDYICTSESTAQKWVNYGLAVIDFSQETIIEDEIKPISPEVEEGDLDLSVEIGFEEGRTTVDMEFKLDTLNWNKIIEQISEVTNISTSDIKSVAIPEGDEIGDDIHEEELIDEMQKSVKITAEVPDSAKGPSIDLEKGYLVEEIGDGLYWITDGVYQTMFLTTGEGVIAIDAPPSLGTKYLKAISEVTDERVTHVIYSHSHIDHIGMAHMFPLDSVVIAHEETALQLELRDDPHRPLPTITFDDSYILEVGNQVLELDNKGSIHEPGNIFIYAPEHKVLMLVDVVFPGWVPFKSLALAADVPAFIGAHDEILNYEFDTFIGGHLTRLGTVEDVKIQKQYVDDLQTNGEIAHETVNFFAIANTTGYENPWLLIDTYMDTVSQTCTDLTLEKWVDQLGGADIFTEDHCFSITESQRID